MAKNCRFFSFFQHRNRNIPTYIFQCHCDIVGLYLVVFYHLDHNLPYLSILCNLLVKNIAVDSLLLLTNNKIGRRKIDVKIDDTYGTSGLDNRDMPSSNRCISLGIHTLNHPIILGIAPHNKPCVQNKIRSLNIRHMGRL